MARTRLPRSIRTPVLVTVGALAVVVFLVSFFTDPDPDPDVDTTATPSSTTSAPATASSATEATAAPSPVPAAEPGEQAAADLATLAALPDTEWIDDGSYAGQRDELFGDAWSFDFDNNGCDARNDMLARDLTSVALRGTACTVLTGALLDPYTGETIDFTRGVSTSSEVQIDHLLPLKAVYATGGQQWTPEKRAAIANDPINLLAVKGSENGSKSDSLPSDWLPGFYPDVSDRHDSGQRVVWDDLPSDTSLQCWYVQQLLPVFVAYELGVTLQDRVAMGTVLETC